MRPASAWLHLMSSTVRIAARTSGDGYGKPEYGTPVAYRCHVSRARGLYRDGMGQTVNAEQVLYLATADAIEPTAQVTMSTGDVGSTEDYALHPQLLGVERRFDGTGPNHVVLFIGRMRRL